MHSTYFSIPSFVRYILYFVVSQASSTGRHGSTDCTVPGAASLADYKVKYISHNQKNNPKFVVAKIIIINEICIRGKEALVSRTPMVWFG